MISADQIRRVLVADGGFRAGGGYRPLVAAIEASDRVGDIVRVLTDFGFDPLAYGHLIAALEHLLLNGSDQRGFE